MINYFLGISPLYLSILGGSIAFIFSVLGAAVVLLFKNINKTIMEYMIALAAGVMLASSFFSLINPAIDIANDLYSIPIIFVSISFFVGAFFIFTFNKFLGKFYNPNICTNKIVALFTSITLHNIPEGLVIGVAFGALFYDYSYSCLISALSITLGIALQNFPEGSALSLPLRKAGLSSKNSMILSIFSSIVEPIFAFLGALLVAKIQIILPIILSLAAGAMIYVTSMELIPECQNNKNKDFVTLLIILGFIIMMILEFIII